VTNCHDDEEATCDGCAFQEIKYDECPNGYSNSPLRHQCDDDNRIYIPRTKKALAEWVAWKLDGFPIDVTTEDKP
jgi:hypothetical protein